MGSLLLLALLSCGAGTCVVASLVLWRRDRGRLQQLRRAEQHDWNNRALSLLLDVASLQTRLSRLGDVDPELAELASNIRVGGQTLIRGTSRLDKVLSRQVDRLHCDPECPGCRNVGSEAVVLLTNLTANAHEAKVRACQGAVVAKCDRQTLTITNPLPDSRPLRSPGLGLFQVEQLARRLEWQIQSGPQSTTKRWLAVIDMND
ncbi:MAG: hypothetical protein AAGD10_10680 [Myxococcota bacterium]